MMKLVKEIRSKTGELHFRRYQLLKTPFGCIYLHKIYKADEDAHLHNHPWNYCSIVLKGTMIEETRGQHMIMRPMSFVFRRHDTYHKIKELLSPYVVTLFFTSKNNKEWGYDVDGTFVRHDTYRKMKNSGVLYEEPAKNIIVAKLLNRAGMTGCIQLVDGTYFNYGVINVEEGKLHTYTYKAMSIIREMGMDYFDAYIDRIVDKTDYLMEIPIEDIVRVVF